MTTNINPGEIVQLCYAFVGAKAALSAVELELFTELAKGPMDGEALRERLQLHVRSARDFFDLLVSLGMLERDGNVYRNTPDTDFYLDKQKPSYVGGLLEMVNERVYHFYGSLTEALKTGQPQNEAKTGGNFFEVLYSDQERLGQFMRSMTGLSRGATEAVVEKFPWQKYETFVDIGTAEGGLPVQVALGHDHIKGRGFDLPVVQPIFDKYISSFNLEGRLSFIPGDFFIDPLPKADVLVMGHVLHDWNLDEKMMLIGKAHGALPKGGALIVYESLIDDERRSSSYALQMSLTMLIETPGGFDYTGADCRGWMEEAGFQETYVEHLIGPEAMVVGIK